MLIPSISAVTMKARSLTGFLLATSIDQCRCREYGRDISASRPFRLDFSELSLPVSVGEADDESLSGRALDRCGDRLCRRGRGGAWPHVTPRAAGRGNER